MKSLNLPFSIHSKIISNMEKHLPEEACGLITGKGNIVRHHFPITNSLHSRFRFQMDGNEMLRVFEWMENHDQILLGIYHSHPNGPENPSSTDLEEDYYPGVIKLVGSKMKTQWVLRAYHQNLSGYIQIPLVIKSS
jgi:[CysO sulfur-carrier protein]-S-L-cysteine hydrolase